MLSSNKKNLKMLLILPITKQVEPQVHDLVTFWLNCFVYHSACFRVVCLDGCLFLQVTSSLKICQLYAASLVLIHRAPILASAAKDIMALITCTRLTLFRGKVVAFCSTVGLFFISIHGITVRH